MMYFPPVVEIMKSLLLIKSHFRYQAVSAIDETLYLDNNWL